MPGRQRPTVAQRGNARDYLYIALAVGAVFGLLSLYAGNLPPVVTVQTGSMMHVDRVEWFSGQGDTRADGVSFGRLGTLDPGDIVLIKAIDGPRDVTTYAQAAHGDGDYGDKGEAIAFRLQVDERQQTIIHRAMTYVSIETSGDQVQYRVYWSEDWEEQGDCVETPTYICTFGTEGVTIRELGIRGQAFTQEGFITKGDNIASNPGADQAPPPSPTQDAIAPQPIRPATVLGEVQGEVPGFGLLRVAFSGQTIKNAEMQDHSYWLRVGNVVAPLDLWGVVLIELGLIVTAPVAVTIARDLFTEPSRKVTGELSVLEEIWQDTRSARQGARDTGERADGARTRE